jgi:uncharacterized sporulation protein YeaH/YhbH (DUF444 family)
MTASRENDNGQALQESQGEDEARAQAAAEEKAKKMLAEMPLQELRRPAFDQVTLAKNLKCSRPHFED